MTRSITSSKPSSAISDALSSVSASAWGSRAIRRTGTPRGRRSRREQLFTVAGLAAVAILALMLVPSVAYAWTPGTHVFLGEAVMRSLHLLPGAVGELLSAFPYDFLYGSIAADTSMAKKYA